MPLRKHIVPVRVPAFTWQLQPPDSLLFTPCNYLPDKARIGKGTKAKVPQKNKRSHEPLLAHPGLVRQERFVAGRQETGNMNGKNRVNIKPGLHVSIVMKKDQRDGKLTEGIVKDILTRSPAHPHGIKVRLVSGQVGRVKQITE